MPTSPRGGITAARGVAVEQRGGERPWVKMVCWFGFCVYQRSFIKNRPQSIHPISRKGGHTRSRTVAICPIKSDGGQFILAFPRAFQCRSQKALVTQHAGNHRVAAERPAGNCVS